MNSKDDYVRKMHSQLDHLSAEIDTLTEKAEHIKADARAEYHKHLDELRTKRDEVKAKLNTLQNAGESAWNDMKAGVELAWNAISEALSSAKSRFK